MSRCGKCGCEVESPFDGKTVIHDEARCGSLAAPSGYAALVREQDAANELYQAACTLMRYKEPQQWHNLEKAAHRFNAARQGRINDEIMRHNGRGERPGPKDA